MWIGTSRISTSCLVSLNIMTVKGTDFRTKEKQYIATQLYKVAERLKILMSRRIANQMYQLEIPEITKTVMTRNKLPFLLR